MGKKPARAIKGQGRHSADLALCKKYGSQRGGKAKALKELVMLPSEKNKNYVEKYQESCKNDPEGKGDMESVRQHLRRLENTYRNQQVN
jgi:hypothetical protein